MSFSVYNGSLSLLKSKRQNPSRIQSHLNLNVNPTQTRSSRLSPVIQVQISPSEFPTIVFIRAAYVRLLKNTEKAAWIARTTFHREHQFNELEMQQASLLGAPATVGPSNYEDEETLLRRVCTAADFIWSSTPIDILGLVKSITFEDLASLPIKDNSLTTAELSAMISAS